MVVVVQVLYLDRVAVASYLASGQGVVVHLMVEDRLLVEAERHLEAGVEEVVVVRHREDRLVVDLVVTHLFVSTYLEMEEGNQVIE